MAFILDKQSAALCVYGFFRKHCTSCCIPDDIKQLCLSTYLALFEAYSNHINFSRSLKWCQIINFVVQIHYDMALYPHALSLCAEYLSYLTNRGYFHDILKHNSRDRHDDVIRYSIDIRRTLFEAFNRASKCSENMCALLNLNLYPQHLLFCNNEQLYQEQLNESDKENIDDNALNYLIDHEDHYKMYKFIERPRRTETDLFFSFSTRYETLTIYLKRFKFETNHIIYQQYKNIKYKYNRNKKRNQLLDSILKDEKERDPFSDHTKFGFLCQYLLEMTYYEPEFYAFAQYDVVIGVIYSAFIIALRWKEKLNINKIVHSNTDLYLLLDEKHPITNIIIRKITKKVIKIARAPHKCWVNCTTIASQDARKSNTHYHACKCLLNCCLNTYLKYSKVPFRGMATIPCFSVDKHTKKFVEWHEKRLKRYTNHEHVLRNRAIVLDNVLVPNV